MARIMTDKKFQDLLDKLGKAAMIYKDLLNLAEEEYKKRYGEYPSEWDDDFWIDTFHQMENGAKATVKDIKESSSMAKSTRERFN